MRVIISKPKSISLNSFSKISPNVSILIIFKYEARRNPFMTKNDIKPIKVPHLFFNYLLQSFKYLVVHEKLEQNEFFEKPFLSLALYKESMKSLE